MLSRASLLIFDRPRLAWLLVVLLTVVAIAGISRLRFDDDYLNLLRSPDRSFAALESSYEDFANEVNDLIVVIDDDEGIVRLPLLRALRRFTDALDDHPDFARPLSLLDAQGPVRFNLESSPIVPDELSDDASVVDLRDLLLANPMVAGHMLDQEARTTLVVVTLQDAGRGQSPVRVVNQRLAEARRLASEAGLSALARVRLAGPPAMRSAAVSSLMRDQVVFATAAVGLALLASWFLFRSLATVAAVVVPASLGVAWTFGAMGLMGERLNVLNGTLVPLLFAISISDSVHLILEMHRRVLRGEVKQSAVRSTLHDLGPACVLTSVTTAIGFGSLMVADIQVIARLGTVCALGVFLSLAAVLVLVPRWADSRYGLGLSLRPRLPDRVEPPSLLTGLWRDPAAMVVGSSVLFAALLAVAVNVRVDVTATSEVPSDSEAYAAFRHVEDAFGGLLSSHVIVRWPEHHTLVSRELRTVLMEVHSAMQATGVAGPPFSLLTVEAAARGKATGLNGPGALFALAPKRVLSRLVEPKTRSALVHARMRDAGARALIPVLEGLRREFDNIELRHPGYRLEQAGLMPVHVATIERLITTLGRSLLIAVPLILVTIGFAFRSSVWAVAALIPNALPLVAPAVYLVVTDWHIGIAGALSFTVALGIAVDDTIHFLERTRFGLERGASPLAAVTEAWAALVPALVATTVIFVVAFGVLLLSGFVGVQAFGGLCCLAFVVAALGDLVVLPAWLVWCIPSTGRVLRP